MNINNAILKKIKTEKAKQFKRERRLLLDQKLAEDKRNDELLNERSVNLTTLEKSYMDALRLRITKSLYSKLTQNRKLPKLTETNLESHSGLSLNSYSSPKHLESTTISPEISGAEYNLMEIAYINDLESSQNSGRKYNKSKNHSKNPPVILQPIGNSVLSMHILGQHSKSANNTPAKGSNTIAEYEPNPSYHIFRDIERDRALNRFRDSKTNKMKMYESRIVKKDFSPKVSINKRMMVESNRLQNSFKARLSGISFVKIFGDIKR